MSDRSWYYLEETFFVHQRKQPHPGTPVHIFLTIFSIVNYLSNSFLFFILVITLRVITWNQRKHLQTTSTINSYRSWLIFWQLMLYQFSQFSLSTAQLFPATTLWQMRHFSIELFGFSRAHLNLSTNYFLQKFYPRLGQDNCQKSPYCQTVFLTVSATITVKKTFVTFSSNRILSVNPSILGAMSFE